MQFLRVSITFNLETLPVINKYFVKVMIYSI